MNTRRGMNPKKNTTRWLAVSLIVSLLLSCIVSPINVIAAKAEGLEEVISVENLEEESDNKEILTSDTCEDENQNITCNEDLDSKIIDDKNLNVENISDEKLNNEKLNDEKLDSEKLDTEKPNDEKFSDEKLNDEKLETEKLSDEKIEIDSINQKTGNTEKVNTDNNENLIINNTDESQNVSTDDVNNTKEILNSNTVSNTKENEVIKNENNNLITNTEASKQSSPILQVKESGIQAYANVNTVSYTAENFFEANFISTNGHYNSLGVFVNSDGNSYLLMQVLKSGNMQAIDHIYLNGDSEIDIKFLERIKESKIIISVPGDNIEYNNGYGFIVIKLGDFNSVVGDDFQFTLTIDTKTGGDGHAWDINNAGIKINIEYYIEKTARPTSATIGDEITYTITIYNKSEIALSGINVIDDVPQGLTITKINGNAITPSVSEGTVTLEEGVTLPKGSNDNPSSKTYTITALVNDAAVAGKIVNTATMESKSVLPKSDTADVDINANKVTVKKNNNW